MKYLVLGSVMVLLAACDHTERQTDSISKSFVKAGEYEQAPFCPPGHRAQALCY